jgi:hypothetical protein
MSGPVSHREAQQRRAHTDDHAPHETPLVRVTRWLAVATIALATAAFLGFGAAILQWRTLSGQLTEMQNASIDMKNSIAASNKLGNETHRLADQAKRSTDNAIETDFGAVSDTVPLAVAHNNAGWEVRAPVWAQGAACGVRMRGDRK